MKVRNSNTALALLRGYSYRDVLEKGDAHTNGSEEHNGKHVGGRLKPRRDGSDVASSNPHVLVKSNLHDKPTNDKNTRSGDGWESLPSHDLPERHRIRGAWADMIA